MKELRKKNRPTEVSSRVLELRVHGVNNTTAAGLLDLRPEDIEQVTGDSLGSFWRPTPAARAQLRPDERGYVPPGVTREAYSWGGMVRTAPNLGSTRITGALAALVVRIGYALILPFAMGNTAQWSRRLAGTDKDRSRRATPAITAALTRGFGLILTLLFTTTVATISLDLLAAQCGGDPTVCPTVSGLLGVTNSWSVGQRFALFALIPVVAVGLLWLLAAVARLRYDVLPGMESRVDMTGTPPPRREKQTRTASPATDPATSSALLAQPGFWTNRVITDLSRFHLAAAIALVALLVSVHGTVRWYSACGDGPATVQCLTPGANPGGFAALVGLAACSFVVLLACVVGVCALPTMMIVADERGYPRWSRILSRMALAAAAAFFVVLLLVLIFTTGDVDSHRQPLFGGGVAPLLLVSAGLLVAISAVLWRPFAGRRFLAWAGCGPAVFLLIALIVGASNSAITVVTVGNFLNGSDGAATLARDPARSAGTITVAGGYLAMGSLILAAVVVGIVIAGIVLALPRDVSERARAWRAPVGPDDLHIDTSDGVLPVSRRGLFGRVARARGWAARAQVAEPLTAVVTVVATLGLALAVTWAWVAFGRGVALWEVWGSAGAAGSIRTFLTLALGALGVLGILVIAALVSGSLAGGNRALGTVWDVVCYFPRTGHPFGPPSYAERAVPEIAGRVYSWVRNDPDSRAVIAAHSMGAVLAVSALGLLASSPRTRDHLPQISLLTFGVQLRTFFGRSVPELLGPDVLGAEPCVGARILARDPWRADFVRGGTTTDGALTSSEAAPTLPGVIGGTLLGDQPVPWVNLWRLSDELGYPAISTSPARSADRPNRVDRYAQELDLSGYMVSVGTHSGYYRTPAYSAALAELIEGDPR